MIIQIEKNKKSSNKKSFIFNFFFPVLITIILFNLTFFAVVLPQINKIIVERKKEMIKELTRSAISDINFYYNQQKKGSITLEQAQKNAINQLRSIRYGKAGQDYFWISDFNHFMIMHPYRTDLEGKDLTNFSDLKGKTPFVEFAQTVKKSGEGYVEYIWQWKDEEQKLVPKLSFVKAFIEWKWIIGTGVYIEDVQKEIAQLTKNLVYISLSICILIGFLLFYLLIQSLRIEKKRFKAETALIASEQKYRTLIESSNEGVLVTVNDYPIFCNKMLCELLGYTSNEISKIPIEKIIDSNLTKSKFKNTADRAVLTKKNADIVDVIISSNSIKMLNQNATVFNIKEFSVQKNNNNNVSKILEDLQSISLFYYSSVYSIIKKPVFITVEESIFEATQKMISNNTGVLIVQTNSKENIGIVTEHDLLKTKFESNNFKKSIGTIMNSPFIFIKDTTLILEALAIIQEKNINYLPVTNNSDNVIGTVSLFDLIATQKHPVSNIKSSIKKANNEEEIKNIVQLIPALIKPILENGSKIESITKIISDLSDTIIQRIIELGIQTLGSAKTDFTFLVFGSEARQEKTLYSDQDNGIIFNDVPHHELEKTRNYFLELGNYVCNILQNLGQNNCFGDVMANNPKWCKSFSEWTDYVNSAAKIKSDQDINDVSIFFDMRSIYGKKEFCFMLKHLFMMATKDNNIFFYNIASIWLSEKPPIGFFGLNFEGNTNDKQLINIKAAIMPLTNFVKLYALQHHISETNTILRIKALKAINIISKSLHDELIFAYEWLMELRLKHQIKMFEQKMPPDNFLDFKSITHIEQSILKKIFSDILFFQAKIKSDFTSR